MLVDSPITDSSAAESEVQEDPRVDQDILDSKVEIDDGTLGDLDDIEVDVEDVPGSCGGYSSINLYSLDSSLATQNEGGGGSFADIDPNKL